MKIPIEVSARHVHLSRDAVKALFGECHVLNLKKNLSQPGQFACEERVNIIGTKGTLENVAVLGPVRPKTQVEVSLTDSIKLGVKCLVKESGNLSGTPGCILEGPAGRYLLTEGLIVAKRHIHMNLSDAKKLCVHDGELKKVKVDSNERSLIYDDVIIRVNEKFSLSMHIDTDEANALNYMPGLEGNIIS